MVVSHPSQPRALVTRIAAVELAALGVFVRAIFQRADVPLMVVAVARKAFCLGTDDQLGGACILVPRLSSPRKHCRFTNQSRIHLSQEKPAIPVSE